MDGVILLNRRIKDWQWVDDPIMLALWIHILINANYQDNVWRGITIHRGEFLTSMKNLSAITGIKESTLRVKMEKLVCGKEIEIKTTNKYSIISVCKYDIYQSFNGEEVQTKPQTNNKQSANKVQTNCDNITQVNQVNQVNIKERDNKLSPKKSFTPDYESYGVPNGLIELFNEWIDMRKRIKKIVNQRSFEMAWNKIKKFSSENIYQLNISQLDYMCAILKYNISGGWQGIFNPPRQDVELYMEIPESEKRFRQHIIDKGYHFLVNCPYPLMEVEYKQLQSSYNTSDLSSALTELKARHPDKVHNGYALIKDKLRFMGIEPKQAV